MQARAHMQVTAAAEITQDTARSSSSPLLKGLAACADRDKHSERGFWRWAEGAFGMEVAPYQLYLDVLHHEDEQTMPSVISVLAPHEMLFACQSASPVHAH